MHSNITFSETACTYIKKMLDKNPGMIFRLSIKKTGCSGYSYQPALVQEAQTNDLKFAAGFGLTVWLDQAWISFLQGVHVDYIEEEKSGLNQKRLVFSNPNEESRCGCGESFHLKG